MVNEQYDVVVAGGGAAGLTAAYRLHQTGARVLLLESDKVPGGRIRSGRRGEYWYNSGAQFLSYAEPHTKALVDEIDVPLRDFPSTPFVGYFNGKRVTAATQTGFGFKLPFSISGKWQLMQTDRKFRQTKAQLPENLFEPDLDAGDALVSELDNMNMVDFLGGKVHPEVRAFYESLMGPLEYVNALTGLQQTSAEAPGDEQSGAGYVVPEGGNGVIFEELARRLGTAVRLQASVERIHDTGTGVELEYTQNGERHRIHARYAVVATPATVTREIVADLPQDFREALEKIEYTPLFTCIVLTNETTAQEWDGVPWSMLVSGLRFGAITHQSLTHRLREQQRAPGSVFCAFGSDEWGDASDEAISEAVVEDLVKLYPGVRGHVQETLVTRWPHGLPYLGLGTMQTVQTLSRPCGRLHLAGDYIAPGGLAGSHASLATATRAAKRIVAAMAEEKSL